jgi:hypothetical protein
MTNLERAKDLYDMIGKGQLMDGFEKYYAEDVVMQELGEEERVGKSVNRQYELDFLANVEDFHGMGIPAMTSDEETGIVMIENWMDATMKGAGRIMMEQVCVQQWKDGQVVKERFFHK